MDEKQKILDQLLESVKHCQIRYGGKSELATENEPIIAQLASKLEAVFNHGLKTGSSWPFIRLHLNRHELERYMLLKHVKTEAGRSRAWLRSSLNEHSLERYLHMMINDAENLATFYDSKAFLNDQERHSILPQLAAGLNSILFAITIDNESLNANAANDVQDNDFLAPKIKEVIKVNKKKKSSARQVITFDEDEIKAKLADSSVIKSSRSTCLEQPVLMRNTSPNTVLTYDDVRLESKTGEESPSDAMSLLSVDVTSTGQDQHDPTAVTKLTPMKNVEVGALIPCNPNNDEQDVMSEDSMSIKSFGEDQDYASAMSSIIPTPQPPSTPLTSHYRSTNTTSGMFATLFSKTSAFSPKIANNFSKPPKLKYFCHFISFMITQFYFMFM